ncbi:MAG: GNAT family N-acetyltransferase [Mogibacterium sp.]|nr:GNAT family N-acetyltransferase [Mogibacterium sp.]
MWCECFGDEPAYVDGLYEALEAEGYALFDDSGKMVSSLTAYDVGEMDGRTVAVMYAVCTLPTERGMGHASELIRYATDQLQSDGKAVITSPAGESLVEFYRRLGFSKRFTADELILTDDEEDIIDDEEDGDFGEYHQSVRVEIIDLEEYGRYREAFLRDTEHVKLNSRMLNFVQSESTNGQGMLSINRSDTGCDAICVVVMGDDERMVLAELLVDPRLLAVSSEITEELAMGLAKMFELDAVSCRTVGCGYTQSLMFVGNEEQGEQGEAYFGFPID